jgi:hypothetical protein
MSDAHPGSDNQITQINHPTARFDLQTTDPIGGAGVRLMLKAGF